MYKFKNLYKKDALRIWIDLSTLCNAKCPQCHRTNPDGLGKVDWLPLKQWTLEDFKRKFDLRTLKHITMFNICGTWGDPIMCREFLEICQYIMDHSTAEIEVNTNGSTRPEEWWFELVRICRKRLTIVFAIDGSTQEIHHLYRVGTNLKRILANMDVVSLGSRSKVYTVVFKHNQHDLDNIRDLAAEHGAETIYFVPSSRMEDGEPTFYTHKNVKFKLEPPIDFEMRRELKLK